MVTASAKSEITSAAELAQRLKQDFNLRVIDVRTPGEFESAHIPGSFNLPLDQLPQHAAELRDGLSGDVVLVCRSGQRARQAGTILNDAELPRVEVLDGGLIAWEQAALPVSRGRQMWSLERQVRAIAGSLVLIGTLVSLLFWPPTIYLAVFVGAGLLFAGVTDTCMMGTMLMKLPFNQAPRCDTERTVRDLLASDSRSSA